MTAFITHSLVNGNHVQGAFSLVVGPWAKMLRASTHQCSNSPRIPRSVLNVHSGSMQYKMRQAGKGIIHSSQPNLSL